VIPRAPSWLQAIWHFDKSANRHVFPNRFRTLALQMIRHGFQ
jgi:hypothetical protein